MQLQQIHSRALLPVTLLRTFSSFRLFQGEVRSARGIRESEVFYPPTGEVGVAKYSVSAAQIAPPRR